MAFHGLGRNQEQVFLRSLVDLAAAGMLSLIQVGVTHKLAWRKLLREMQGGWAGLGLACTQEGPVLGFRSDKTLHM
jgi:hypothetical protein